MSFVQQSARRLRARHLSSVSLGVLALLSCAMQAQAADYVWKGTTSDWATQSNWTPEDVPKVTNDTVHFGSTGVTAVSASSTYTQLLSLHFDAGAQSYSISTSLYSTFVFGDGVFNNSGLGQTINIVPNTGLYLNGGSGSNVTYNIGNGGTLFYTGLVAGGDSAINFDGNGTLHLGAIATVVTLGALSGDRGQVFYSRGFAIPMTLKVGTLNTDTTFGGTLTESIYGEVLSLEKVGTGTLTLTGANTYSGLTTVSAGTLQVGDDITGGSIGNGAVSVNGAAATLSGYGTIGGSVTSVGGTVRPGGATAGTLSVLGTYSADNDSALTIFVSPTAASKLAVTGAATVGGRLNLVYQPGVYTSRDYEILSASSVSGTFDTVTGTVPLAPLQRIDQEIEYGASNIIVSLTSFQLAPTETDVVLSQSTASLLSGQGANDVLLGAAGSARTGSSGASAMRDGYVRLALADDAALAGLMPAPSLRTSVWMKAIGRDTDIGTTNGVAGFEAKSGGFMIGADRALGGGFTAGVAAGYSHTGIDDDTGSEGTIETGRFAAYGQAKFSDVTIDATLGYAHDSFEADRAVAGLVASSEHDGDEINAGFVGHTDIALGDVTLTPKAGLRYVALFEEGYTETGAPGFNLAVDGNDSDSLQPFVGAEIATSFKSGSSVITPSASIEYARELMDDAPTSTVSVGGGTFAITGVEPSRDRLTLGVGLDAAVSKSLSLQVGYRATLPTGNLFEQVASVGAEWRF